MIATISIILVLASLIIIALIIIKKFPALAILDVENIPGKKEEKFKEEIIKKRMERDLAKWGIVFVNVWNFFNKIISGPLHRALEKLTALKDAYRKNRKLSLSERREKIRELFREAQDSLKNNNLDQAEASLIEIIGLDQKKLPAFIDLADVYTKGKKWAEARQTLGYALKLIKAHSRDEFFMGDVSVPEIYFSLSWVYDNLGDEAAALDNIQEALEFESNNPRYLDYALELAIKSKVKDFALLMLERLREVNPDNAKLTEWEEKIANLSAEDKEVKDKLE
jgi:tetratricopeptide (TPR) repeat protein